MTIQIREVCPRDGLQDHPIFVSTEAKLELISRLHAAGMRRIEVTSFVSATAVPQMADAASVCAGLKRLALDGCEVSAFAATRAGATRAVEAGVGEISVAVAATDAMNHANFGRSTGAMLDELHAIAQMNGDTTLTATVAVAFGCPYAGDVLPHRVLSIAHELVDAGYRTIFLGDTIGIGTPERVSELVVEMGREFPEIAIGAHFHDRDGQALDNVRAAIDSGILLIDTSLGGLGGCPFAPGAGGNVATEDVVVLLETRGIETGASTATLDDAAAWLRTTLSLPQRTVPTSRERG